MLSEESFKTLKAELFSYSIELEKDIKNVFSLIKQHNGSNYEALMEKVRTLFVDYSKQKKTTYEKYDIDNELRFNFFESISDKWYRENFHSDILEATLNPKTPEIGRKEFLKEFVSFLGISKEQFDCDSNYVVIKEAPTGKIKWIDEQNKEREKEGFIDLLIRNEHQAIIIENKINYAPDMENQLVRYMKYVKETLKISNYTVVYLTLINDKNKKPPLDSYDKDFEKYTNKLKDNTILKEAFAVDSKKSIAKDFIPNCQEFLIKEISKSQKDWLNNPCNITFVYLEQYRVLLNHLGGIAYMTTVDKKIFEEIYSDKKLFDLVIDFAAIWNSKDNPIRLSDRKLIDKINSSNDLLTATNDFIDLWNYRWEIPISELLLDKFHSRFPTRALESEKLHGYTMYTWMHPSYEYKIYWYNSFQIGYTSLENKTFTKSKEKELKNKLANLIGKEKIETQYSLWICYDVPKNEFSSLDEVINLLGILLSN